MRATLLIAAAALLLSSTSLAQVPPSPPSLNIAVDPSSDSTIEREASVAPGSAFWRGAGGKRLVGHKKKQHGLIQGLLNFEKKKTPTPRKTSSRGSADYAQVDSLSDRFTGDTRAGVLKAAEGAAPDQVSVSPPGLKAGQNTTSGTSLDVKVQGRLCGTHDTDPKCESEPEHELDARGLIDPHGQRRMITSAAAPLATPIRKSLHDADDHPSGQIYRLLHGHKAHPHPRKTKSGSARTPVKDDPSSGGLKAHRRAVHNKSDKDSSSRSVLEELHHPMKTVIDSHGRPHSPARMIHDKALEMEKMGKISYADAKAVLYAIEKQKNPGGFQIAPDNFDKLLKKAGKDEKDKGPFHYKRASTEAKIAHEHKTDDLVTVPTDADPHGVLCKPHLDAPKKAGAPNSVKVGLPRALAERTAAAKLAGRNHQLGSPAGPPAKSQPLVSL